LNRWLSLALAIAIALTCGIPRGTSAQPALEASEVISFQIDGGHIAGLSPDGRSFAVLLSDTSLCVFDASTIEEKSCAALDAVDSSPSIDDIVWSPDSTRLAVAEIGMLLGRDGDLWVMDATTGALTNLTDEGYSGYLPTSISPDPAGTIFIDDSPAWTPDGHFITFARSTWIDGSAAGTSIAQVPATGGAVETLAVLSETEPGIVRSRTAWTPDGSTFYFTREANNETAPDSNGIWSLAVATGEIRQIASADDSSKGVLTLLEIAPAGDMALAWYPGALGRFDVESPLVRLVDLATGKITIPVIPQRDEDALVGLSRTTFSPDGSALLHVIPTLGASDQLWIAAPVTADPVLVLDEIGVETGELVNWASDGTVLVGGLYGQGAVTTLELDAALPSAPSASAVTTITANGGQVLGGSPDGTRVAVLHQQVSLCILEIATQRQVSCASLEDRNVTPRPEDVVWSPDGTRLAFTELGFVLGTDSDLWVMDAASGALTNLTDDGVEGALFTLDSAQASQISMDASPAWTPDGQFISFGRSGWANGTPTGTVLARVPAGGGPVDVLAQVSHTEPGALFHRSAWSPDGATLYYTYSGSLADDPRNGVWTYSAGSGEIGPLALSDGSRVGAPALLQVSPTGSQLLVWYPQVFLGSEIADPLIRLVDSATGSITVPEFPPPDQATLPARIVATFSPDGQSLLFLLVPTGNAGQLWVSDPATGEATRVVDRIEGAQLDPRLAPTWSRNGTVVLGLIDSSAAVTTIATAPASDQPSLRELIEEHTPGSGMNAQESA
jgi:Tol biopolymer transport system component